MIKKSYHFLQQTLKRIISELLTLTTLQVAALSVTMAVLVSMVLVSIIDFLWYGSFRFNTELQFAGVVVPFIDSALIVGVLVALLSELRDEVKQRTVAEETINNLAFHDPLTGLPNRRLLIDRLHQAFASNARSGREGALLFIDLDNVKSLNDSCAEFSIEMTHEKMYIRHFQYHEDATRHQNREKLSLLTFLHGKLPRIQ